MHKRDVLSAETVIADTSEPRLVTSSPNDIGEDNSWRFLGEEEIGRGGMAVVYRVRDPNLLRFVALKRLDTNSASEPADVERFIEEAQITGQLDHPNVVPVHEVGMDSGTPYFVMKLVSGRTFARVLGEHRDRPLLPGVLEQLIQIFFKVCDAVAFAHSRAVVHRDLKPSNIMVGDYGQVYVMDWGLARVVRRSGEEPSTVSHGLSRGDDGSGTVWYMAPEQAMPDWRAIDERTDVFALGALLYEILTGRPPHEGTSPISVRKAAFACEIMPPEEVVPGGLVAPALSRIAMRALARLPEDRYQSVLELHRALESFLRSEKHLESRVFAKGEWVVREGEEGDAAYIITKGRCRAVKEVDGRTIVLREMGPGDVFGETAVFSSKPRTASVEAIEEMTVLVVRRDTISEGLGLSTWLGKFVTALADRFRELDERLTAIELNKAPGS